MSLVAEYVKTLDNDLKPMAFELLAEAPDLSLSQLTVLMRYFEALTGPTLKRLKAYKTKWGSLRELEAESAWLDEQIEERLKAQANLAKRLDSPDLSLEEILAHCKRWEPNLYKFFKDYQAGLI